MLPIIETWRRGTQLSLGHVLLERVNAAAFHALLSLLESLTYILWN